MSSTPSPASPSTLGTVALLHPGAMGAAVGAALVSTGHKVLWAGDGRSAASQRRAHDAGLTEAGSLADTVGAADTVLSVCPPGNATEVAQAVIDTGFTGRYVDANAIAPTTAAAVAAIVTGAGGQFIDGGIIGLPPTAFGTTRLYLSGPGSDEVARAFDGSVLEAIALDTERDASDAMASQLKACYAGWTKGSTALLLTIRSAAEAAGIGDALLAEWARSQPNLEARTQSAAAGAAPKAWRWVDEMLEIAHFLDTTGVPNGALLAASEIYRRLDSLKDQLDPPPVIEEVTALINRGEP